MSLCTCLSDDELLAMLGVSYPGCLGMWLARLLLIVVQCCEKLATGSAVQRDYGWVGFRLSWLCCVWCCQVLSAQISLPMQSSLFVR